MTRRTEHDLVALFGFAVREHDWVLADLMAETLRADAPARDGLERTLRKTARNPGAPRTLARVHRWAELTRSLERD